MKQNDLPKNQYTFHILNIQKDIESGIKWGSYLKMKKLL